MASDARSSWLIRRCARHQRSSPPNPCLSPMPPTLRTAVGARPFPAGESPGRGGGRRVGGMKLPIHSLDTAPAEAKALLEGIESDLGLVPNLAATASSSPTLLAAFDALRRIVGAGSLDPVLR